MRPPDDLLTPGMRPREQAEEPPTHGPDLKFCARIRDDLLLAVTVDPGRRAALTTNQYARLSHYSYPDFQLLGSYRLVRTAYRAVLDGRRGLLYLASSEPEQLLLGRYAERGGGRGDIEVYDVQAVLEQKAPEPSSGPPRVRTIPLSAEAADEAPGQLGGRGWARPAPMKPYVADLLLSPDGEALYYLADFDDHVRIGRADTRRPDDVREVRLKHDAANLRLTRDGKHLYATRVGKVLQLDPRTLRVEKEVAVNVAPSDLAVTNAGLAFLGEWGQWTSVTVVDMSKGGAPVGRWKSDLYGPLYLGLSADEKRLYVGSASPAANRIRSLLVTGDLSRRPPPSGEGVTSSNGSVTGEFYLTPDGDFLINHSGKVYHLYHDDAGDK
jgi:hypothetical protein